MLSSTNESIKYFFLNNYYSSSSQGSNGIFLNPMTCPSSSPPLNPNIEIPSNQEKAGQGLHHGPSKRRSERKKYRVKKIYTAQGLRDRRVRLSKEVAHKFFKLHDTLGFDQASKTLEWLLNESGKAIEQLGSWKTASSINEEEEEKRLPLSVGGAKGWSAGLEGAVGVNKESRAKARARARERTRAKTMNSGGLVICHEEENCDDLFQFDPLKQLPGWSLSQEYLEDDGQNPFVVAEAREVEGPRSKPSRFQESILLTKWFTGS